MWTLRWFVCCLFIRPGEDQRSETEQHRGHLAEAAACGGVWRLRYEPHRQAETSCTTAAGPGWGHCFSIHKSQLYVGDSRVLHPQPQRKLRHASILKFSFSRRTLKCNPRLLTPMLMNSWVEWNGIAVFSRTNEQAGPSWKIFKKNETKVAPNTPSDVI